ncbi:MAG: hypothetical protein PWQ55_2340 [Chloroflexota bacterium]|nr:hypothetical protein [Chloroflexota bacterium]
METVIVITGAGSGIGLGMTQALLADGHKVAALDLNTERLRELETDHTDRLLVQTCDITEAEQVAECVQAVQEKWGHIDVLVNNACLAIFAPFEQKALADTRRELEVNYFGALNMIQAVLPAMKAQGSGLIHNFSSGVGISGFPGIYGYASTKGAIESLTRTLALELRPYGITVNLMHPPLTNTPSARPLGIPAQMMDDPDVVGARLARQILSTKDVITPDLRTRIYLFCVYRFPLALGRLFADLTEKARAEDQE